MEPEQAASRTGRADVLGCPVDVVTLDEAVARVERAVRLRAPCQHMSMNAAKLVRYQHDRDLQAAVDACELITADGQAIVWAARFLGRPLPERVAGVDLMEALLEAADSRGYAIFLLGARPEVLVEAELAMRRRFPRLRVVGRHHGYFAREDEDAVVDEIAAGSPDLLFVALETPAKELFLARHRERLAIPFVMGVGGAFDVMAGVRRRAPLALRKIGLEWFYRLAQDPRRMARRYVVGNSRFIWLLAREVARGRARRRS